MKSVTFNEATNKIAEHQDEFQTVHSQFQPGDKSVNICWELEDEEIEEIIKSKKIWYKQVIGDRNMNPMLISTKKDEIIKDSFSNLDTSKKEGRLLISAIALLMSSNFPNKTPQSVCDLLKKAVNKTD